MPSQNAIHMVIEPRERDLGGFMVRRALPYMKKRMVGPFIFLDQMGPSEFQAGQGMDVRPHPHIGLSTLTYLFEGRILHRDSLGSEQLIEPGAVNWMTAGHGIAHSERTPKGDRSSLRQIHGIQTWIALPLEHEDTAPSFHHHAKDALPEISLDGTKVRLIAGRFQDHVSPVQAYSRLLYLDCDMKKNQSVSFHEPDLELALFIASGAVRIGDRDYGSGQLVVFEPGAPIAFSALQDTRGVVVGGVPFNEPRFIWWNFVASSKERIEKAADVWESGRFEKVPTETEFIPLPEGPRIF